LTSCQLGEVDNSLKPFFDITDFLENEIQSLENLKSVKKKVSVNENIDEQVLTEFDLEKDLTIFKNSNINKVTWLNKYEVDSVFNTINQLESLKYLAKEKKLKTQEMVIQFENEKVKSILIKNNSSSFVSSVDQQLNYFSKKGYSIENNQNVKLTGSQTSKIEVEYLFN